MSSPESRFRIRVDPGVGNALAAHERHLENHASPADALRFRDLALTALGNLAHFPVRQLAPEAKLFGDEIYQLVFRHGGAGHVFLYTIRDETVRVVFVRFQGQNTLTAEKLSQLTADGTD